MILLGWKHLLKSNALAFLCQSGMYVDKMFYKISARAFKNLLFGQVEVNKTNPGLHFQL